MSMPDPGAPPKQTHKELLEKNKEFFAELHEKDPDDKFETIVTVKKGINWEVLHNELTRDTTADPSVDSNIIPDRTVDVIKLKSTNKRNTHYNLSPNEAKKLKNDPRIEAIEAPLDPRFIIQRKYHDGGFEKSSSHNSNYRRDNWGLLRHCSKTNNYGSSTSDPGGSYDYVLDGTGVDVVAQDSGVVMGHPEWEDSNGVSRYDMHDWYSVSGISGTQASNFYSLTDGSHGSHVMGTIAGKNFGWAKNSKIYSMRMFGSGSIGGYDGMDIMRGWHNNKNDPNHALWTGTHRPTVVNMSWGSSYTFFGVGDDGPSVFGFPITSGNYRGNSYSISSNSDMRNKGLSFYGYVDSMDWANAGINSVARNAEVEQMIDDGIIVCIASGNDGQKWDLPSGADWDNYVTLGANSYGYRPDDYSPSIWDNPFSGNKYYYNRGGSPNPNFNRAGQAFVVGSINYNTYSSTRDRKSPFSSQGPGVNIWTAGERIISCSDGSAGGPYYHDTNYWQERMQGTSMASPQAAGMAALIFQLHPDWTPKQVVSFMIQNAIQSNLYSSKANGGLEDDYTNHWSLFGSEGNVAYIPMANRKPWNWSST
tara:strand:- start:12284 stop:14053 length:1770 start_codon:yes stop_codon:yes gene_type:complete